MTLKLAEQWLKTLAVIHILGGLALPLLVFTSIPDSYFLSLETQFPNSNPESLRFLIGIFGPTVASWGILFYYAIHKAFQARTSKDWWFLVGATLVWVILDTSYSLHFKILSHLYINSIMLTLILIPLLLVKNGFKKIQC